MNGSTNVQISALAAFVSVTLLWLASYFAPELMASAPSMLGEMFTGALIVLAGVIFKPNAGFKVLPGTGDDKGARSPVGIGLLAGLLALLMFAGCGIQRPPITSIADGIAVTAADVETAAVLVKGLCLNLEPGGPCAQGAAISTGTKEKFKAGLLQVIDGLRMADLALSAGELADATDRLARTQALLAILRASLARVET